MTFSEHPPVVNLTYHYEDGSWWADSPNLLNLFAGGDSLDDAKALAHQVVADELGDDVLIVEWTPLPAPLARQTSRGPEESRTGPFDSWHDPVAPTWDWNFPKTPA